MSMRRAGRGTLWMKEAVSGAEPVILAVVGLFVVLVRVMPPLYSSSSREESSAGLSSRRKKASHAMVGLYILELI